MNNFLYRGILFLSLLTMSAARAQKITKYNLSELNRHKNLVFDASRHPIVDDPAKQSVTITGIVFLKNVNFSTGSIDVDLRGTDVFQQSFLGIAFHAVDTITYECIYFRPFNFQSTDSLRRRHAVQYMSEPDFPWDRLRNEHPLIYESGVNPIPKATDWFHAHVVVTMEEIIVYVNHSDTPSLKVKKLNKRNDGLIGLWSSALSGDFANLQIKKSESQ